VDGSYYAECLTEGIMTHGDTWDELPANVKEAVDGYCFDSEKPKAIRLHLVRNEVLLSA
jgi:predicted RNase H-like HicB family nuclease